MRPNQRLRVLLFSLALAAVPTLLRAQTQTIGAFITPVSATASSSQSDAGRTPDKLIDGSGWYESKPGSGVYVHTSNVSADGICMWNGDWNSWLSFDLGRAYRVRGVYVWNYNEPGWLTRGVKDVAISSSVDGSVYTPIGTFTLQMANGDEDPGQNVRFPAVITARFFKWQIVSNYKNGEMSGLAAVRFADADRKAIAEPAAWKPQYSRPLHLNYGGKLFPGEQNYSFPLDSGVVNLVKAPYNAVGDGKTDNTAAIQKALDDYPDQNTILYLPNGVYKISSQLHWGGDENQQRNTTLWGQSRDGTVLQLVDSCPGFNDQRHPMGVLYTGHAPAQRFGNEIHDITVDTGCGNIGACGIQFIANNQGGVYETSIVSGDGQGFAGLDLGYTAEQGPCLIKDVSVEGFETGILANNDVDSITLENIKLEHQSKCGILNAGQPISIHNLTSVNTVPAFHSSGGLSVIVGANLTGIGDATGAPAIIDGSDMLARNITVTGYRAAIENHVSSVVNVVSGPEVAAYFSKKASSLFGRPGSALDLPIENPPSIPWGDPASWTSSANFKGSSGSVDDDGPSIQRAIDSGASTVYLPKGVYHIGSTIVIRGNVRRIIGLKAYLIPIAPLTGENLPLFKYVEGSAPAVVIEGINTDFSSGPYFFMQDSAKRTLILRRLAINFGAADAYRGDGGGTVFIEDVVGRHFYFHHQHLWARQFNPEGDGMHVLNEGGTAWILGLKTEGGGTLVSTTSGGATELLGGFSYAVGAVDNTPMFVVDNSKVSLSFSEVCFTGKPFTTIVSETQNGEPKTLTADNPAWRNAFALYSAN